jgi:two-component system chemotaxis response regulator CheB
MSAVSLKAKIGVLVCDDSAFSRITLRKIIESDPAMRVVDIARNGKEAVEKALKLNPDVITLDVNMPGMDGLTALKEIVKLEIAPVIMVASTSGENAHAVIDAIEAGAFDFISKPDGIADFESHSAEILQEIKKAVTSDIYKKNKVVRNRITDIEKSGSVVPETVKDSAGGLGFKLVALGISTGGPRTIFHVLPGLPKDLNAAVIVVQHMPAAFIPPFTQRLGSKSAMKCVETEAGMKIEPGNIYIAAGGYHLKLVKKMNGDVLIRQAKEPQHLFMPSVDIMMDSVVAIFGSDTVGVLMTGMGRDGAEGMVKIRNAGGITIAESEETAVVFGMPQEAINRGAVQVVAPAWTIAREIVKAVEEKK